MNDIATKLVRIDDDGTMGYEFPSGRVVTVEAWEFITDEARQAILDAEPRTVADLIHVAQFEPESLTEEDLARISAAMNDLTRTLIESFTPAFKALGAVFSTIADALLPYVEYMPGPEFRRFRKTRQLREHRERVAARIPAWKRTDR